MPRRNLLTPAERASLLAFPTTDDELIQYYTFSEPDLSAIRQRRGDHNRLASRYSCVTCVIQAFLCRLTWNRQKHYLQSSAGS